MNQQRYVGQSVAARKEDHRLLTGAGSYVDDAVMPGLLHAAFRRSDAARGDIVDLDLKAAQGLPGVRAVFTAEDFEVGEAPTFQTVMGPALDLPFTPLAAGHVRFVGDPVALVVADSRYVAEDACDLIEMELDLTEPVVDYATAGKAGALVHDGRDTNFLTRAPFRSFSDGLDTVFARAGHVIEATIEQHRYLPVPMEPRGIVASWNPRTGELIVVVSTQSVHESRVFLGRYLSLPVSNIRVIAQDVGGGFGQKMFIGREELACVLATRELGQPVKWIEDRRENLIAAPHARSETARVRMAVSNDREILAVAVDHTMDVGAYPIVPNGMDGTLLTGPYKIAGLGYSSASLFTNTMGRGAYRAPWMFESTVREVMIEHVARELGWDPAEFRRRNMIRSDELPYTNAAGRVYDEVTPLETLDSALKVLDYEAFRSEQQRERANGRYLGVGMAVYLQPSAKASPTLSSEAAVARIEPTGEVSVFIGTCSHGQSVETTMAQIVADTLGVDVDDVTVRQGDTQSTPYGGGTGGSRTAVVAGGAVMEATTRVREKVMTIAAYEMEASTEDLEMAGGIVWVRGTPSKSLRLADIARIAYVDPSRLPPTIEAGLEASARFRPTQYPTWSNGTHACVVEVDIRTCCARVLRYVVSEDCGRIINPHIVDGQVVGAVAQGIGGVLLEHFVYDPDGNPLTTTFMDYLLATTTDVPAVEVHHLASTSSTNPGGFKGMGEGGALGSHAAVTNAVADALWPLGVRVTSTPLGPNEIFELLRSVPPGNPSSQGMRDHAGEKGRDLDRSLDG